MASSWFIYEKRLVGRTDSPLPLIVAGVVSSGHWRQAFWLSTSCPELWRRSLLRQASGGEVESTGVDGLRGRYRRREFVPQLAWSATNESRQVRRSSRPCEATDCLRLDSPRLSWRRRRRRRRRLCRYSRRRNRRAPQFAELPCEVTAAAAVVVLAELGLAESG